MLAEKVYSSYGLNTLGPLCLWQCLVPFGTFVSFWYFLALLWYFLVQFGIFSYIFELFGTFGSFWYFFTYFNVLLVLFGTFLVLLGTFSYFLVHFQTFWYFLVPFGICISSCFGHQVALLELVANVAARWHYLYKL